MERLSGAAQFIKKEALVRTAGSMLVGIHGGGEFFTHENIPRQPSPLVRTIDEMHLLPQDNSFYTIKQEIKNVDRIRDVFDDELGTNTRNKLLSWDPVKSRNRYEQCQTEEERADWLRNEFREITTSLRERYNCLENPMDLVIDSDGLLRNKLFPAEPLQTILQRGVAYQETHGSKELERERSEVEGILKIQADLTSDDAEDGDTRLIFSPPGMVEGSPYTKHFADRYILRIDPDTGERIIDAKRFSTIMSSQDYHDLALTIDPTYFDNEDGPLDAILLRKPLNLDGIGDVDNLLEAVLRLDPEALTGYKFEIIHKACESFIPYLIQALVDFKPQDIARILNTMFYTGDNAEKIVKRGDITQIKTLMEGVQRMTHRDILSEIEVKGNAQVETRQVGCGDSGSLSNSVGMFGFSAESDPNLKCLDAECTTKGAHFHCPGEKPVTLEEEGKWVRKKVACKESILVGRGITTCPSCGEGKKC